MNQLDWEKTREEVKIVDVTTRSPWFVAQSEFTVNTGSHISGTYTETKAIDGQFERFRETPFTSYTPAFIGYRSNTGTNLLSSPKNRTWNGTTWDASETEMPTAGSPVTWVRVAYSPLSERYYEKIVVTLGDDGYLDAYVWNGTSWIVTNNIGYTANDDPAFDIEYEKTSGDALLVYYNDIDASAELGYRIWDGTTWSSEYAYDLVAGSKAEISSLRVAQKPTNNSNEIALICTDRTNRDAYGIIWDGDNDAFGNQYQLETEIREERREPIAVAYEQTSGNAMFVWGDGTARTVQSRRWLGTSWESTEATVIDIGERTRWLSLKADPSDSSNRLMLVSVDRILDLNTADWNGTVWTAHTEHDADVDDYNARVADFEWEPSGSKGLLVWGTTAGFLSYKTFTAPSTWSSASTVAAAGTHPWVQLRRNPRNVDGDVKILGAMLNSNFDIGALKWDGLTLTNIGDSVFTSDTTVTRYECFDIKFSNFYVETGTMSALDIVGTFVIDVSTYPLAYIQTVEMQLRYRADDAGENWYLKAYNWTAMTYSDSGFNSTAGHTPTTEWDYYALNLTDQWRNYVKDDGTMYIKFHDEEPDSDQTTIDIDFLGVRALFDGTLFVFKNEGAITTHLVSLWIINSTSHQRYDISVFMNPGETLVYLHDDIRLPNGQYTVKVVTERGNAAVYSGG